MKKFIKILSITICITLMISGSVFAAGLQAYGTSSLGFKTAVEFFGLIRQMESATGTLGVSEDYSGHANNIDCHLEKNTEYGAITILASSPYGRKTSNDTTSTGKGKMGVMQMAYNNKAEVVANTYQENSTSEKVGLTGVADKYVNNYVGTIDDYTSRGYIFAGDGIIETDGWGGNASFLTVDYPFLNRGYTGIFGYHGYIDKAVATTHARAVVVCGPGL